MKKCNYLPLMFLLLAFIMVSCEGNSLESNLVENKTLGKFPSVFVELIKEQNKMAEDMRAELQAQKDPNELREKYVSLENESKQRAKKIAETELEKIIERTVPFEVSYDDPNFEIRSAMIDAGDPETGALTIVVVVGAKNNLAASMDSKINYHIVGTNGDVLFAGAINPFVSNQIITSRTFPYDLEITAGDVCSDQGSWLMLYCGSYNFTDFEKIVFIK